MAIKFITTLFIILISIAPVVAKDDIAFNQVKDFQKKLKQEYSQELNNLRSQIKNDETIDPDSYTEKFKKINFKIYSLVAKILIKEKSLLNPEHKTRKLFSTYRERLSQLEYQELKVEKIFDLINNHFKNIEDKQYAGHWRLFIDYISWQYGAVLNKPTGSSDLVITNKGICPGVNYARENKFLSFSVDACLLQTSGGVSSIDPTVTYTQSNISATGIKSSISIGYFVSASKTEIGLKIPLMLISQDLEDPPAVGYKVKEGTNLIPMAGLYSRWPIGNYFFQTEFSKYLEEDQTQWALGLGYKF